MLGAFMALIFSTLLRVSTDFPPLVILGLSLLAAIVFCSGYGITIERIAYKRLRNSPRLTALISAIGMSLVIQNYVRLAQSSNFLPFRSIVPDFAFLEPVRLLINSGQFVIMVTTLFVMLLLTFLIKFTRLGKAMRAAAQDKVMSQLVGINVDRVISYTFAIGSATAAVGGVLIADYAGQINFYIGFMAGMKAFIAAVLGGIGSIPGAVLGSYVLGITESLGAGYISSSYEDAFAFIILILILLVKPSGIMGLKETEKV